MVAGSSPAGSTTFIACSVSTLFPVFMVKLSVCIAVYNAEAFIATCAKSLFSQSLKDGIEFIFSDDSSTDHSLDILRKILSHYPERVSQVHVIPHKSHRGAGFMRAEAMRMAQGEYLIHCDADDWVDTDMYEYMLRVIQEEDADLVYCDFSSHRPNGRIQVHRQPNVLSPQDAVHAILREKMHGSLCNKIIRHNLACHPDIWCPNDISMCEDVLRNVQTLLHCERIIHVEKAFYHVRIHESSLTRLSVRLSWESELRVVEFFDKFFSGTPFIHDLDYQRCRLLFHALIHGGISKDEFFKIKKRLQEPLKSLDIPFPERFFLNLSLFSYSLSVFLARFLFSLKLKF